MVVAEITDSTNVAQAFAFLPLSWSTGATIGGSTRVIHITPFAHIVHRPLHWRDACSASRSVPKKFQEQVLGKLPIFPTLFYLRGFRGACSFSHSPLIEGGVCPAAVSISCLKALLDCQKNSKIYTVKCTEISWRVGRWPAINQTAYEQAHPVYRCDLLLCCDDRHMLPRASATLLLNRH